MRTIWEYVMLLYEPTKCIYRGKLVYGTHVYILCKYHARRWSNCTSHCTDSYTKIEWILSVVCLETLISICARVTFCVDQVFCARIWHQTIIIPMHYKMKNQKIIIKTSFEFQFHSRKYSWVIIRCIATILLGTEMFFNTNCATLTTAPRKSPQRSCIIVICDNIKLQCSNEKRNQYPWIRLLHDAAENPNANAIGNVSNSSESPIKHHSACWESKRQKIFKH